MAFFKIVENYKDDDFKIVLHNLVNRSFHNVDIIPHEWYFINLLMRCEIKKDKNIAKLFNDFVNQFYPEYEWYIPPCEDDVNQVMLESAVHDFNFAKVYQFGLEGTEILDKSMEFFNKMGTKKIYKDLDKWWNCVTLGLGSLAVSHLINGNKLGHLNYHLHSDTIRAHTLNGRNLHRITSDQVRELLDVEVDESKLTDYQKELIDDSESTKKEIVIDDCKEKVADFDIEEYPDAIHLVKRKGFYRNF